MRVMTWNVWWRFQAWDERRHALLAVLRDEAPDIVGLQEVWGRGGDNLAAWLADALGMRWTWAPFDPRERWRERVERWGFDVGVAVLSRWPIADRAAVELPAAGGQDDGRMALHALVDAPGHRVPFFTTHLNGAPGESAVRCAQVRALAAFVAERRAGTAFPAVVTGDFNAWPDSDEMRLLGGYRTRPAVPGQVLIDAWEYAPPGTPAATWDAANPHTAPHGSCGVRIDYVHVGLPGPRSLGRVRAVRRAGTGPVDGVWPSDHTAVVADLHHPAAPAPEPGRAVSGRSSGPRPR
ncbi:endonuclease/exonuclease/phosphatase family protein [Actinomadura fibrosa]|uniref:Endonuclease/exonuclease/phosphatase family protein n=1 Tax=Actinomadura fibrosa TaxID=111802 RepID=A0ABW2XJ56_9ACTN|nr:endonuclease/exonuclease/phosphatase family protein [Actinomadura fibrosa]